MVLKFLNNLGDQEGGVEHSLSDGKMQPVPKTLVVFAACLGQLP